MRLITGWQHKIHTAPQNLGKITKTLDRNSWHHRSGKNSNDTGQFTPCHKDTKSTETSPNFRLNTCKEKVPRRKPASIKAASMANRGHSLSGYRNGQSVAYRKQTITAHCVCKVSFGIACMSTCLRQTKCSTTRAEHYSELLVRHCCIAVAELSF